MIKSFFYLSIVAVLLLSCSQSKKTNTGTDFETIKLKGLPVWQLKKEVAADSYSIFNIDRTWTKGSGVTTSRNNIKKEKERSKFTLSFDVQRNKTTATTKLSNNLFQSDLTLFKEYINIPLRTNELVKGDITVKNAQLASFIVRSKMTGPAAKTNGQLYYNNFYYKIHTKYKVGISGLEFSIYNNDQLLATGNTIGTIQLLKEQPEELKHVLMATLSGLIFNRLNTQS
ncbi:MAG: hypothetical protein RIR12_1595 [Bacteroidota bacterium]|jgi:hypothetical protein